MSQEQGSELNRMSVTYTATEVQATEHARVLWKIRNKFHKAQYSNISAYYVPVVLGAVLIGVSALRGVADAAEFLPLLITGAIGYLAGYYALYYELIWAAKQRTADWYRAHPAYMETCEVTLSDEAVALVTPRAKGEYFYGSLSNAAVIEGMVVMVFNDTPELLAPVSAFASAADAEQFAATIRERIKAAKTTTVD